MYGKRGMLPLVPAMLSYRSGRPSYLLAHGLWADWRPELINATIWRQLAGLGWAEQMFAIGSVLCMPFVSKHKRVGFIMHLAYAWELVFPLFASVARAKTWIQTSLRVGNEFAEIHRVRGLPRLAKTLSRCGRHSLARETHHVLGGHLVQVPTCPPRITDLYRHIWHHLCIHMWCLRVHPGSQICIDTYDIISVYICDVYVSTQDHRSV